MPPLNSEKDNYTIDEMMGRLNKRQEMEPELVTRADGSRALKVKKSKRRSDQSAHKRANFIKRPEIIQISIVVIFLALVALVMGASILYVNSPVYRDSLISKLEIATGGEVKLRQFRMNPLAAKTSHMQLSWPAGHVMETLEIHGVTASILPTSLIGSTFGGEEVVGVGGKLLLKANDPSEPIRHVPRSEAGLPIKFPRYAVSSLDVHFGEIGGLTKTEASLSPGSHAGEAELRFNGGLLQLIGWPSMTLGRSYMKVKHSELLIRSMRFYLPGTERQLSGGSIDFSGSVSPMKNSGTHTLAAKVVDFPVADLMGVDLGRFFVGKVDSVETPNLNSLSFNLDSPETAKLELMVTNSLDSRINMSGFKFLQMLSVAFSDRWYDSPVFEDEVSMAVKKNGQNTHVSGINLVKRGRLVVRGEISNGEGGSIRGELRIGVPEAMLSASEDKKLMNMFGPLSEGYRWLDVGISGTGAAPEDDFRTSYMDTSSGESSQPAPEVTGDSFEDLIRE